MYAYQFREGPLLAELRRFYATVDQDDKAAPMFMQEWALELMVGPTAELADSSQRPAQ